MPRQEKERDEKSFLSAVRQFKAWKDPKFKRRSETIIGTAFMHSVSKIFEKGWRQLKEAEQ